MLTRFVLPAAATALALTLTGCAAPSTTITSTGRVKTDVVTAQAPTLAVPRVNLNAGFTVTATTPANLSAVPTLLGLGSAQRVSAVEVTIGDQVKAGDVLVRFDDAALAANVTAAKADLAVAKAQVGEIDSAIDTVADKKRDLQKTRTKVTDGIAKATDARKTLVSNLAKAKKARVTVNTNLAKVNKALKELPPKLAQIEKNLAGMKAQRPVVAQQLDDAKAALAALPADAPPEQVAALQAAVQKLTAALAGIDAGIAQLTAAQKQLTQGIAQAKAGQKKLKAAQKQLNEGIPKLTKGIATIDGKLVEARDGLKTIDKGLKKLDDARADLTRGRKLAVIAAGNDVAVQQARTARAQAVVTAPRDGTVTSIAHVGDVVAPGATVAELSSPAHVVELWLAPAQADRVCVGDAASIAWGESPTGTISRILPEAQYPPTYHTTDEVHLTRAVPVEVTVSAGLPPGVPVDVQLTPCRTNEVKK